MSCSIVDEFHYSYLISGTPVPCCRLPKSHTGHCKKGKTKIICNVKAFRQLPRLKEKLACPDVKKG